MKPDRVSIGSIGEIRYDEPNDRWKGLLIPRHEGVASVVKTLTDVLGICKGGSRINIRLFTGSIADIGLISRVQIPWEDTVLACEAIIPIRSGEVGSLMYFSANRPHRRSSAVIACAEWELFAQVDSPPADHKLSPDFAVEILKREPTHGDLRRLCEVYKASFSSYITEFTEDTLAAMAHDNIVAVVREVASEKIVAVSQAEIVMIEIPRIVTEMRDGKWRLVEISETACDPDYRGHSLTQFCKARLLQEVKSPSAIIYTESRANHAAVLRANLNLGMKVAGRLDKHCVMDSSASEIPQEGPYANLFVLYVPYR